MIPKNLKEFKFNVEGINKCDILDPDPAGGPLK
jgi:hypothetical protein